MKNQLNENVNTAYDIIEKEVLNKLQHPSNCKLYPPYKSVLETKQKCYPLKSEITVTESSAQIKLQSLLNHTVERILLTQTNITILRA